MKMPFTTIVAFNGQIEILIKSMLMLRCPLNLIVAYVGFDVH